MNRSILEVCDQFRTDAGNGELLLSHLRLEIARAESRFLMRFVVLLSVTVTTALLFMALIAHQ